MLQGTKQQYYTGYTEDSLMMTMKHMAKNVVKVNETLTKYTVSITKIFFNVLEIPLLHIVAP